MPHEVAKKTIDRITVVLTLLVGGLTLWFLVRTQPTIVVNAPEQPTEVAVTPDIEAPTPVTEPEPQYKGLELLKKAYIPSSTVYTTSYEREALRVTINGQLKAARLLVRGEVLDDGPHFLSINIDNFSGVYGAVRKAAGELDVSASEKAGGVFTRGVPIDLTVDMKASIVFATSRKDFLRTSAPTRNVVLWKELAVQPPTVVKLLVAPFNRAGRYGGAQITSLRFEYQCEKDSDCAATLCQLPKIYTQCLEDDFGYSAAKDWCNRSDLPACAGY